MPILPLHAPGSMGRPATTSPTTPPSPLNHDETSFFPWPNLSTATQNVCLTPIAYGYPSLPSLSCGEGELLLSAPSLCTAVFNSSGSSMNLDKEPQAESDVHDVGEHTLASRVSGTGYGILKEAIGVVHRRTRPNVPLSSLLLLISIAMLAWTSTAIGKYGHQALH
jgi:hypothetical protein